MLHTVGTILLGCLACGLGQVVVRVRGAAAGGAGVSQDVLAVVFGEARQAMSAAAFDRANLYFHGGVSEFAASCTHVAATASGRESESEALAAAAREAGQAAPGAAAEHHHDEAPAAPGSLAAFHYDPWNWLDAQIHPNSHKHLQGAAENEVLPWVAAAVKLDRSNTLAYAVGAYWLARRLNRTADGLQFIAEGIERNPRSTDLEFCRGEILLHAARDFKTADLAFAAALQKWRPTTGADKDDNDQLRVRALMYRGDIADRKGHIQQALEFYREALRLNPLSIAAVTRAAELTKKLQARAANAAPAN